MGSRRTEEQKKMVLPHLPLFHLKLSLRLLLSCPSPFHPRPLACAPQAPIELGSSVTKATREGLTTISMLTTSGATAATRWTAPPTVATMTSSMAETPTVTKGGQDIEGGSHPAEGREEGGEGGTETGGSILINTSTISSTPTHTSILTMHHSSQDPTLTTTVCHA